MELVRGVLAGDRRSIARAISLVEGSEPQARALLDALYFHTGQAHVVGVTGSPGTGKSTLVNQMARLYRQRERRVGIVAVDPTSPFSGGALLGDRVRMRDVAGDPGVFVRSMATRGALGGLARATYDAAQILDAAGFEVILIETVGAGQDEVSIARTAHTTVVVEAPGLGDDIQAIKAGLMEIADVFVVNKADRQGAEQAVSALEMMLELGSASRRQGERDDRPVWKPPICKTVATDGTGVGEVIAAVEAHRSYLLESDGMARSELERARSSLEALLRQELYARFLSRLQPGDLDAVAARIASRQISPYAALDHLLEGTPPHRA